MDFVDKFKRILGLSPFRDTPAPPEARESYQQEPVRDQFESPLDGAFHNFNIFTDPIEMHKYFEQQMDEMLKNFGFNGHFGVPAIEGGLNEAIQPRSDNLREQFLKPGVEDKTGAVLQDDDLDGKLDIKDWGSVFKGAPSALKSYFRGQSVMSKTITNSDGSMETHRSVRDNEGNEETIITRKIGDKEYSIVKKRDKDGKEEVIENFVNLEEQEVDNFFPKRPQLDHKPPSFYDQFFK